MVMWVWLNLFFRNFVDGKVIFGDFFDQVLSWWPHKDDKNVLFLMSEEKRRDLPSVVACMFIGIDISAEVISQVSAKSTFDAMKGTKQLTIHGFSRWEPRYDTLHEGGG